MSEGQPTLNLTKSKRALFICAVMLVNIGFMAGGYGAGVALPRMLVNINGMDNYALASALSTVGMMLSLAIVGKLGNVFGLKAVAIFGIILQIVLRASFFFITDPVLFMILYSLSNFGAGLYLSAPYVLLADAVDASAKPKYYGILATCGALGSLVGPIITGIPLDQGLVPFAFIVYVPFMILALPFICALYPNKKAAIKAASFDFAGIILLVIALVSIILWLTQVGSLFDWISPASFIMLAVGIIGMIVLVKVELKHENPSVAIYLFRKKRFRYAFLSNMFLAAFSVILSGFVIVYAQQVMQVSATLSGTATMPMTIARAVFGVSLGTYIGQNFAKRFRPFTLLSLALAFIGILFVCMLQPDSSMVLIYVASVMGGIGSVVPQTVFAPFFQSELQVEEYGAAQGLYTLGSSAGSCVFAAVAGMMMNMGCSLPQVFIMGGGFCFLSLLFGIIGLRLPKETPAVAEQE